ncbi:MAG: YggS family pyridoxal phosphate-dependent enzyme [Spartobacteria bacterium]
MKASPMEESATRLQRVQEAIAAAAKKSGRSPNDIELIAVSKTHPAEAVQAVAAAGHLLFGENRVQEARAKIPLLPARLRWHFIGHLQKNKIRHALPLFELFHGIDSLALAQDMQRIADEDGMQPRILLEVNVAGEASKHGFTPEAVRRDLETVLSLGRLTVEGLMAIPPFAPEAEASRPYFVALRELRDQLKSDFGVGLPQLSMGMSGDYAVAIEEGASLVRVGTAIFGERPRRQAK